MSAVVQSIDANPAEAEREQTDGFNLVIDASSSTASTPSTGVPGIPITDFGRMAQAAGIRCSRSAMSRTPAMRPRSRFPDQETRHLPHGIGARLSSTVSPR